MARSKATSVLVVALLGCPPAEAFVPSASVRSTDMQTGVTMVPPTRTQSIMPGGSEATEKVNALSSPDHLNSPTKPGPCPKQNKRCPGHASLPCSQQAVHCIPELSNVLDTLPEVSSSPSDGETSSAEPLPESLSWRCINDTPWRRRARQSRMVAASTTMGLEAIMEEGDVCAEENKGQCNSDFPAVPQQRDHHDVPPEREKKRDTRGKELSPGRNIREERMTAPVLDAVGMTVPLVLIVVITMTQ